MARVLVAGEALVDIVVGPDGTGRGTHPGGSPANVALGLARLDHDVRLLTWIGTDPHGRLVLDHLAASNVDVIESGLGASRTSSAVARLDAEGTASYEFDIEWRVPGIDLVALASESLDAVHTGSIAAVLAPGASAVESLLERLRPTATISYDPNARPALMGDHDLTLAKILAYVQIADVVKVSDEDLAWLRPGIDPLDVAGAWLLRGPSLVVVTRGEGGADAVCRAGAVHVDTPRTDVVDTVGAGDAFSAGLLDALAAAGLLGARHRTALRAVDTATVRTVLTHAAAVASITCSRPGADPPWRRELGA